MQKAIDDRARFIERRERKLGISSYTRVLWMKKAAAIWLELINGVKSV
jgi:hypothetical protein